ncbi:MAG TPA: response regulator transcription factor [Rhizobacter sp.]|nr:response regulator transcription factor [Rhizobacter sp.]
MPSIVLLQRDHEASPRLCSLIDASENFRVCGTAHTIEQARPLIRQGAPDILVTDMRVQDGDVQPLLTELRRGARTPGPHVVVTMLAHDDTALLEALRAGADGYWVHTMKPEALIGALAQAARGESPISPTIARQLLSHFRARAEPEFDTMTESLNPLVLTDTEQEILHWAAQGYLIDEIAQQWQWSAHSVACGIRSVYHKLQFDRRASSLSLKAA